MVDFEVQKFTRRCAASERELKPGETFFSVLVAEGADVVRRDFAAESWQGPPEDVIGWWRAEVPDPRDKKVHWAPNDIMLHYFQQLQQDPDKQIVAYVLALLLIRRRVFKLEGSEVDDQHREVMLTYCPRNEKEYRVLVATPATEEVERIQQELAVMLFAKPGAQETNEAN